MNVYNTTLEYFRSRQQELETEHKAVEQQLRELVDKPGIFFFCEGILILYSIITPFDAFEISCI